MPMLNKRVLEKLRLGGVTEDDLDAHFRTVDRDHFLEVLDEFQGLLLGTLGRVNLHVHLSHSLEDYRNRELIVVFGIDALRDDDVGDVFPQVLLLVLALEVTDLHIALVEDFDDDLLLGEVLPEHFEVALFGNLTFRSICEYFIDLQDLIYVGLGLGPPVKRLVPVASQLELFPALLKADEGDISHADLVDRGPDVLAHS